jgi:hypothetical protein
MEIYLHQFSVPPMVAPSFWVLCPGEPFGVVACTYQGQLLLPPAADVVLAGGVAGLQYAPLLAHFVDWQQVVSASPALDSVLVATYSNLRPTLEVSPVRPGDVLAISFEEVDHVPYLNRQGAQIGNASKFEMVWDSDSLDSPATPHFIYHSWVYGTDKEPLMGTSFSDMKKHGFTLTSPYFPAG